MPSAGRSHGRSWHYRGIAALAALLAVLAGKPAAVWAFGVTAPLTYTNGNLAFDGSAALTNVCANVSGTVAIANGGTGQTTATAAFNALDPLTTKGDIVVHNGTDSIRLPVGSNTQVLTADSSQAAGVKWAAGSVSSRLTFVSEGPITVASSGAPTYIGVGGKVSTTEADVRTPVGAFTFAVLRCYPSATVSPTVTATLGNGACTSTATYTSKLACTVSTANTPCTDSANSTAPAANDCVALKASIASGGPTGAFHLNCVAET